MEPNTNMLMQPVEAQVVNASEERLPTTGEGEVAPRATRISPRSRRRRAARRASGSGTSGAGVTQSAAGVQTIVNDEAVADDADDTQLFQSLEAGGTLRSQALESLRGSVHRRSFASVGCRVVQLALKVADRRCAAALVQELHGAVLEAVASPHANFVIQGVIEQMPMEVVSFIVIEITGKAVQVARHRFGCRILCRLLEHSPSDGTSIHVLVNEILENPLDMCRHTYAHHVVNSILEHGLPEQRQRISDAIKTDLVVHACGRNTSYVVEKLLIYGNVKDQEEFTASLGCLENLILLGQHECGSFVVRSLARMPERFSKEIMEQARASAELLAKTKHGRRLLQDLGIAWSERDNQ